MGIVVSAYGNPITVLDIIEGAYRLLQVKSPDTELTADEAQDGFEALNMMIDSWSNESLMLYHVTSETFNTVAGQQAYTIGFNADFNTERPISIEEMTVSISGTDWPVKQLAYDDYSAIRLKTLNSNFPRYFYVDEGAQLSTIHIYPVPANPPPPITLYSLKPLSTFLNITQEIVLPRGYLRTLKFNLAVEVAPEFQTSPGQDVRDIAIKSKALLKRTNTRMITSQTDMVVLSSTRPRFNIYSGQ